MPATFELVSIAADWKSTNSSSSSSKASGAGLEDVLLGSSSNENKSATGCLLLAGGEVLEMIWKKMLLQMIQFGILQIHHRGGH